MPKTPPPGGPAADDASRTFDEEATPVPGLRPELTFDEEADRPTPPRRSAPAATPPAPAPLTRSPVTGQAPALVRPGTGDFAAHPAQPPKQPKPQSGAFDALSSNVSTLKPILTKPGAGAPPAHRPVTGSFLPLGPEAGRGKVKTGSSPAVPPRRGATGQAPAFLPAEAPAGSIGRSPTGSQPPLSPGRPATGQAPAFSPGKAATDSQAGRQATGQAPAFSPGKAATDSQAARRGTGQAPAFNPGKSPTESQSGRRPTGLAPAFLPASAQTPRPATGQQPAFTPQTGTFAPVALRDEAELKADPSIDAAALQREVRARSMGSPGTGSRPAVPRQAPPGGQLPATKPAPAKPTDTFVKQKMKEAETNLPDLDFDFPDDEK